MAPRLTSRAYHSPSSDGVGLSCVRKWWYIYREGRREPRVTWVDIMSGTLDAETVRRNRASALGVAVHGVFEADYLDAPGIDWRSLPGQIAMSGRPFLPHRDACEDGAVERPIGDVPIVGVTEEHAPPTGLVYDGVTWAGYRDLVALPTRAESKRLELDPGWLLVDYKTKGDLRRALTSDELSADFAANLYAFSTCVELGLRDIALRWLNIRSKRPHVVLPVDVRVNRDDAEEHIARASKRARELDAMTRAEDAPVNVMACGEFGGCPHHKTNGGPCDATASVGALMQARVIPKERKMAIDPKTLARFNKNKPASTPPAAAASDAPAAPRGRGRPPKAVTAPPAPVEAEPDVAPAPDDGDDFAEFTMPTERGPLTLRGHSREVLRAVSLLMNAG